MKRNGSLRWIQAVALAAAMMLTVSTALAQSPRGGDGNRDERGDQGSRRGDFGGFRGGGRGDFGGMFGGPGGDRAARSWMMNMGDRAMRNPFEPISLAELIRYPAVREEIKFTDEQQKKWDEASKDVNQRQRDMITERMRQMREQGGGAGGPEAWRAMMEQGRTQMQQFRLESEKILRSILNKDQERRLEQIAIQRQGPPALVRDDVARAVALLPPQQMNIRQIVETGRTRERSAMEAQIKTRMEQMKAIGDRVRDLDREERGNVFRKEFEKARPEMEKAMSEVEKTREEINTAILKVLNRNQKKSWERLQGAPFDMDKLTLRSVVEVAERDGQGDKPTAEADEKPAPVEEAPKKISSRIRRPN